MDWDAVFKIISATVVSFGGAGAIIVVCSKFVANYFSEKMMKKYDAKLNKDIEEYKHRLELETEKYRRKAEQLTFVTQRQFEQSFQHINLFLMIYLILLYILKIFFRYLMRYPLTRKQKKKCIKSDMKNIAKLLIVFRKLWRRTLPLSQKKTMKCLQS